MKKIVILIVFVLSFNGLAQTKEYAVSGGLEIAFPTGEFSELFSTGIGVSAVFENKIHNDLNILGAVGYLHFNGKMDQLPDYNSNAFMLLAGVKYFFLPGYDFYGISQLGLHFFSSDEIILGKPNSIETENSSKFSFAIGGGYELPVNHVGIVDFCVKYTIISDNNYFGIRAGYKYIF